MDNKLSELSKPVAWEVKGILCHSEEEAQVYVGEPEPLYSQEYVSALLAELEAKDRRIAGLARANKSQDDHINQQQDRIDSLEKTNAGLGRGLAAAEQKLATPVRLPTEHELHQVACSECAGNCLELVESTVRSAGFTVEGDE